jgi:prevent-host-death family protein
MTRTITAVEAEAHLSDWLHAAESGDTVLVTRDGRPVAALVSTEDLATLQRIRAAGPGAGLAGLAGRYSDGDELAQELDAIVAARTVSREPPDLGR